MPRSSGVLVICLVWISSAYGSESMFGWSSWAQTTSMCDNADILGRSKLRIGPKCTNACFERFSESKDTKYEKLINIALKQPAEMSSRYRKYGADHLTDGITNTNMAYGSCAQTNSEYKPWFRIDLHKDGYKSFVEEVIIYNRFDCCSKRANNIKVTIGDNPTGNGNSLCKKQGNMNIKSIRLICEKASFGRYIHLRLQGPQILHLCEVQAIGGRYKNIALGKSATAWTPDSKNPAERLVDGKFDKYAETSPDRQHEANPWFRIDLGQEALIYVVHLYIGYRANNIENSIISVGTYENTKTLKLCGAVTNTNKIVGKIISYMVKCKKGMKGRYVQISMISKKYYLSIREVEVLADV